MYEETITFDERYPHEKGFAAHFDKEIAWRLLEVESDRLRAVLYRRIANAICYPLAAGLILLWIWNDPEVAQSWPKFVMFGVILGAMAGGPARMIRRKFEGSHKAHLMGAIMGFFKDANYNLRDHLRAEEIKDFMICPSFNICSGSDLMDVESKYVSSRLLLQQESSGEKKKKQTKFRGIGVLITLPYPVRQPIGLKMDRGSVVNMVEGMLTRYQRINLVDPVFEDIFQVYGKDQIEARMVLTTDVMELFLRINFLFSNWNMEIDELEQLTRNVIANHNIEEVRDNLKPRLMANYMDDKLLLLIETPKDMFTPVSINQSALDLTPIRAVLYQVNLLNQLHEVLTRKQMDAPPPPAPKLHKSLQQPPKE